MYGLPRTSVRLCPPYRLHAGLRAAKIDPKDVSFVSIATEDVPALVAGQIDTAILHVEQEIIAQSKIPSLHAIARLWEIQPDNLYNVMAVMEKTIQDKRAALKAFVKGHIEATRLIYTDKAKVIPIIVKYTKLPADVVAKSSTSWWMNASGMPITASAHAGELYCQPDGTVGNIQKGNTPIVRGARRPNVRQRADQGARRMERSALPVGQLTSIFFDRSSPVPHLTLPNSRSA